MKIALVTGAYKGLGLAWCRALGRQGYTVLLTARDLNKAEQATEELKSEGLDVYSYALDISNELQLLQLAKNVADQFGKMDLIVNNAGINPKDYRDEAKKAAAFRLDALDADVMADVLKINSIAPLLVVKHFRQLLKQSDEPKVINISSWLGSVTNLTFGGHYGYVGSKNLLNVLNKSMAYELKEDGIISVNVNPGWVQTDMGGSRATYTPDQSVALMIEKVVNKISLADSGGFFDTDGSLHPW